MPAIRMKLGGLAAAAALLAPGALAQTDALGGMMEAYVTEFAVGLPDYFVERGTACLTNVVAALSEDDRAIMAGEEDFIAGVNALAAAKPDVAGTLFPGLDGCLNTIIAGEMMRDWIEETLAEAPPAGREQTAECMLAAVAEMEPDAKLGVIHFRFGDFGDAIIAMLDERPDLAGTFIDDAAACGVTEFAVEN